jgi:hypothetical protein
VLKSQTGKTVQEGVLVGLIGAGSVGAWFFLVDLVAGKPLFTPAVLGSAVFSGLRDPATVTIALQPVLAYTAIHLLAFIVIGLIVATILAEARRTPPVYWLLIELFVVFEFGFLAAVGFFFTPLLAALAWINVAVGNLIAAGAMGYYLWRRHGFSEPEG